MSAAPLTDGGFAYMWAGVRGTYGFLKGKLCYELKVSCVNLLFFFLCNYEFMQIRFFLAGRRTLACASSRRVRGQSTPCPSRLVRRFYVASVGYVWRFMSSWEPQQPFKCVCYSY